MKSCWNLFHLKCLWVVKKLRIFLLRNAALMKRRKFLWQNNCSTSSAISIIWSSAYNEQIYSFSSFSSVSRNQKSILLYFFFVLFLLELEREDLLIRYQNIEFLSTFTCNKTNFNTAWRNKFDLQLLFSHIFFFTLQYETFNEWIYVDVNEWK